MHDPVLPWILLYIGPEAFLPFTSALAAIAGAVLIFWNRLAGFVRRLWQMLTRRPE
jgi:hypothetical protein